MKLLAKYVSILFIALFNIIAVSPSLCIAADLFLSDKPVPSSDIVANLGIYVKQQSYPDIAYGIPGKGFGGPGLDVINKDITTGTRVSLGKYHVAFIPPLKYVSSETPITPDRAKWDLYLISIPFTIHQLDKGVHFTNIQFHVQMLNNKITAFDLLPKEVTRKEETTKTYTLSPSLKFKGFEGKIGDFQSKIIFEKLYPIINAYGIGESQFYWIFKEHDSQPDISGVKYALIVLEVPAGTTQVKAKYSFKGNISKKSLFLLSSDEAYSYDYSTQWKLNRSVIFK